MKDRLRTPRQMHPSLKLLCGSIFVLTAMPRCGLKIGPLPIYVIDILVALTFYYASQRRPAYRGKIPFIGLVKIIFSCAIIAELYASVYYGTPIEPVYMLIRTLLAVSLFFSVSKIIQSEADLGAVIKAALMGLIITSALMIMTSLPFTRDLVSNYIFSNVFLEPAAEQTMKRFEYGTVIRGRSLVGVSILSGAFINIIWPLAALLYQWPKISQPWKLLALAGCILAPFGAVMSYSRGAILGLFFVVGGSLFFGSDKNRQGIIVAVLVAVTLFSVVGWNSEYFYFKRVEKRTRAMVENPYEDERETERIFAYTEPFEHLIDNPDFLLIGEGLGSGKISVEGKERRFDAGKAATHAVFAKAYYTYGMFAAVTYMLLVANGFSYLLGHIRRSVKKQGVLNQFAPALFASMLGFLPWFVFGHAAVSQPRGAMMMFFVFGLLASLKNLEASGKRSSIKKRNYANRRHSSFR